MHVCMLVGNPVVKDPRVRKEAQIAADHGMRVTVIGRAGSPPDQAPSTDLPYEIVLVPLPRLPDDPLLTRIINKAKFSYALYKTCVGLRPDLIHANDFDTLPSAYYAGKRNHIPVIYDSHEIWTEFGFITRIAPLKWLLQRYERFLLHRIAGVLSVSHTAADQLARMYQIPRPHVITNCPYALPNRNAIPKNPGFEVLFHGIFSPGRGYEEFCLAAQHLSDDITLVLRGFGPSEDHLRALVNGSGAGHRVRFDAPVDVAEMTAAAARSHVGAVLTRPININFTCTVSNKLFEYLQAGLPVIMSDVPEHRLLNERFGFGLIIDDVTPQHIARAILQLKNDPPLFEQLRARALRAADELVWEKEGLKLIDIYRHAVAAHHHTVAR